MALPKRRVPPVARPRATTQAFRNVNPPLFLLKQDFHQLELLHLPAPGHGPIGHKMHFLGHFEIGHFFFAEADDLFGVASIPSFNSMQAVTRCPHFSSGRPTTSTCFTLGDGR